MTASTLQRIADYQAAREHVSRLLLGRRQLPFDRCGRHGLTEHAL